MTISPGTFRVVSRLSPRCILQPGASVEPTMVLSGRRVVTEQWAVCRALSRAAREW